MEVRLKKGIIYYRVSTEDQAQFGVSLEQQKKHCLGYSQTNGIEVVKMFHDDGVSAKTTNRDGLQEMLNFIRQKGNSIDCVIVYKIDRLTRSLNDYTNIIIQFNKLGIRLISTTEAIDDSPSGELIGNMIATIAQFDNKSKGQRVSACMKEKTAQGQWCWLAPVGYLNARDGMNKKTVILDNKRAPIIAWFFKEYSTGLYSLEELRQGVVEKGLKSSKNKEVPLQLLSKIIKNRFYIGKMVTKSGEYDGLYEKLIDEETFYKCQNVLRGNNRSESISRNQANENFPLRHFVLCANCTRPLTAYFATGKLGGRYPYYRCYNKACGPKKSIAKKQIENDFKDYLYEITPKTKFLTAFKATITDVWETEYEKINQGREDKIKLIENLKKEKEELINMKKRDLLPDEDFKEDFNKIKRKIDEQEAFLSEDRLEEFEISKAVDYVFDFIKDIPEYWGKASFKQKIGLQGLIFPEKPLYGCNTFQTPKLCPILQTKKDLACAKSHLVGHRGQC